MIKDILIAGYGVVGRNLAKELAALSPDIYDKYKPEHNTIKSAHRYGLAFICVDTPYIDDERPCDTTEVANAIAEVDADCYCIKSTVLPGTTDRLAASLGKRVVFSPEYYGGTQHCNNYHFAFTILGGEKRICTEIVQLLQRVYDGRHTFRITDARTAELTKYMENAYLATKVSFCCQFFEIAKGLNVSYEELRELFILDPRVNPSHTFVYADHPYWESHCLDKDVPAIAAFGNASLLKAVIAFNQNQKVTKQ